jgi:hypothetical protein
VGDRVEAGQPLATVHGRRDEARVAALVRDAFVLADDPVARPALVLDTVGAPA